VVTLLFLDDWALQTKHNLVRRMGTPRWVPEATLEDDIVDGTWNFPFVFHDRAEGKWKAFYKGVSYAASDSGHDMVNLGLLYAESPDGIHWAKPDVAARSVLRSAPRRRPNQVFSFHDRLIDGGPVFLDSVEPDPQRRLKFIFTGVDDDESLAQYLATSPDGFQWTLDPTPWGADHLDAPITAFHNRHRGTYVISRRPAGGNRRVAFSETTDFTSCTVPQTVVHPDPLDPDLVQFYGMPVYPYEDIYVGLLQTLHTDPDERGMAKIRGYVDGGLTYSYDGWIFNRTFREPFVPRTPAGEQGSGGIYPSTLLVDDDHRIRIYSAGSRTGHFHSKTEHDAALLLHTLRLDGFMYLETEGSATARALTRPLDVHGPDLRLNVEAPYGRVRVQLCEVDGSPIPGLTFDDCVPFTGDALFHEPKWTSGMDITVGIGRRTHLEIEVSNGRLYSVRGDLELR
jgi:hypothetical protein